MRGGGILWGRRPPSAGGGPAGAAAIAHSGLANAVRCARPQGGRPPLFTSRAWPQNGNTSPPLDFPTLSPHRDIEGGKPSLGGKEPHLTPADVWPRNSMSINRRSLLTSPAFPGAFGGIGYGLRLTTKLATA
jgi:hypothetical protein